MAYLIFMCIALAGLIGFFVLSSYEVRKGKRVFAHGRARLDTHIERITFILEHVNFGSFLREEIHRMVHTVVHFLLQTVRAVERFLTNLVRYLRTRHPVDVLPQGNTREFVKALSDFKDQLRETPPHIPDIY